MTDLDALLKAVIASPHENTPRLIYADALDERGRKADRFHAELIRLQVSRSSDEGRLRELCSQVAKVVVRLPPGMHTRQSGNNPLIRNVRPSGHTELQVVRGFADVWSFNGDHWFASGSTLRRDNPITEVCFTSGVEFTWMGQGRFRVGTGQAGPTFSLEEVRSLASNHPHSTDEIGLAYLLLNPGIRVSESGRACWQPGIRQKSPSRLYFLRPASERSLEEVDDYCRSNGHTPGRTVFSYGALEAASEGLYPSESQLAAGRIDHSPLELIA